MDDFKTDAMASATIDLDSISKRLKFIMKDMGIKQTHMAKKLGITRAAVSYILNSDVKSSKNAMRLAEKLNVNKQWLLTGLGEIYKSEDKVKASSAVSVEGHLVPVYYVEQLKLPAANQTHPLIEPIGHVVTQRTYLESCFAIYLRINDFAPRFEAGDQLIFITRDTFVNNEWILVYRLHSKDVVFGQGIHTADQKALLVGKESGPIEIDLSKDKLLGVYVECIKLANYSVSGV